MEIRIQVGLNQKLTGTVFRETCTKCGQFSVLWVKDKYATMSYGCSSSKCWEDRMK